MDAELKEARQKLEALKKIRDNVEARGPVFNSVGDLAGPDVLKLGLVNAMVPFLEVMLAYVEQLKGDKEIVPMNSIETEQALTDLQKLKRELYNQVRPDEEATQWLSIATGLIVEAFSRIEYLSDLIEPKEAAKDGSTEPS